MKKLSGLLAVSLVAVMMAPAARAEIASTAYVDNKDTAIRNDMEAKENKATKNYTSGSTTEYPSIKVAEDIAKIAAGAAVGNYALKTELEEEADARGQADTAIKVDIKKNADAITVNTTAAANAKSAADAAQKTADGLKTSKQDKLTAGTGIKIDATTNTISTDGLATNSDLTALQKTVSGHTTSINKLDGADTVDGSVKQQIKTAKSELTTNIQENATAAANAKSAADAAQATADKAVVANKAITADTGTKITYDTKGLVTGSTSLAASDIPALATSKITGLDTALAAKFVAPGTSVTSTDGTYTLTMKVADGKPTYAWEAIGRGK